MLLPKQFNANDGELTRTLKIRRKYMKETYNTLIEDMYSEVDSANKVTGDGKIAVEKTGLQVIH